ncbi:hypothetical protein [Arundinibacter roseus]|uniref:Uncharacterized protein n=1 Tax=Arundinibacter roseus TaxID=2070510 RepID=A0A4R4KK93_9BACT|nr:hypothetical protein [Arundinibacter roseus]TDB67011.1 hypothetical protein EZE20_07815 [Arundinibacter roseus]
MNPGFDPAEIAQLKKECRAEGKNFVYVEDGFEEEEEGNDEHAHIQFIGYHNTREVVYDALIYTLRLHHATLVYDLALERLQKQMPDYISPDERGIDYPEDPEQDEEAELLLTEFIEEIEENEEVKVQEHVEIDTEFEYGIGLEVGLNRPEITVKVIDDFIAHFNADRLKLDPDVYTFHSSDEEDDD